MPRRILLGLNQYTHSAACCLLDLEAPAAAEPLFALAKERVTRKKHDGGDVAELLETALETCGLEPGDLVRVVANNHLFRIRPMEETLPWAAALHQYRPGYLSPLNLLPGVPKHEISHHLAHAWSVLPMLPFDRGLIVVMDGMGSPRREVLRPEKDWTTDASLPRDPGFQQVPAEPDPGWGWREGETVYRFEGLRLSLLFKRWIRENSPDFLYNYGFENMESLGALYSRVSSHVFGDWNACGKVMGLAPWAAVWAPGRPRRRVMEGPLEELRVDWKRLRSEPAPNAWAEEANRPGYARLAADLQEDLEEVVVDFLRRLQERTGERAVALAGGVALNCVLNGRIARDCGFEEVFVPPWPGDDGVALGCAWFGRHVLEQPEAAPRRRPVPPALGRAWGPEEVAAALRGFASWVEHEPCPDPAAAAAADLAEGRVVAWFQGRSEFGPRALGQRSFLAHPGDRATAERLNREVKGREPFRPFAPAVLEEEAAAWFEPGPPSPWMSFAVRAREALPAPIEAVLHVDRSARWQTVGPGDGPLRPLLEAFHRRTGLPLVLNTSFNRAGEPIVETPADALRSFLDAGADVLYLEDRRVLPRPWPGGEALLQAVPVHDPSATVDTTTDLEGEVLQVLILHGGRTLESDALEAGVLEHCDGTRDVAGLLELFEEAWEEPAAGVLERLERLWRRRLVGWAGA